MTGRSRSSTLSSTRSPVSHDHQPLHPAPAHHSPFAAHPSNNPFDSHDEQVVKSYRSEHSLRTLRAPGGAESDEEGEGGERAGGDSEGSVRADRVQGLQGRRVGPQFVIDLAPTSGEGGAASVGGRPRATTFGGVELPPSPNPALQRDDDHAADSTDEDKAVRRDRPALGTRGRSTSVSSVSSLRSLDPSLHLGGTSFSERRPLLYASLQAAAILLVSALGMYIVLKVTLPPIDEGDRDKVKLPKSFEDLKELNEVLQVYRDRNYYRVMGCFVIVYLFLQAFSIPGSMYLSMLGGALFGVLVALPLVCFCVATGALLCYLLSALLGPSVLANSSIWQARVEAWQERVRGHEKNLVSYLIVLRIAPLPPHWMLNLAAPHVGVSVWKFWLSTFLGVAGVSYIHTQIGTTLDQMAGSDDLHLVTWQNACGLGGIIVAVLIPVFLRRLFAADLAVAAQDPSSSLPPTSRVSLDLESGRLGTPRELLDGTVRSSTDGSARVRRYEEEDEEEEEGEGGEDEVRKALLRR
ncbi:Golgi apparatus membrane protein TVP38 [Rhodotorula toruloides]|nr:Golgi apparatus membrane protein TVP38 [Rhodotorula toruloides]